MWRRIPILPMLFGACAALSLMTLVSFREPLLEHWRPYATVASLIGFVGLGLLGGMMLARSGRSETDDQAPTLEAQAEAFAREQLELARDLQQRLLPPSVFETDRYRVTARNVPAEYVAGDFYDFVPLGDNRLLLVLADVSEKGVKAGLITAAVKSIVPLLAVEQSNPAPLLGRLNERLADQLPQREFVAIALAIYDAERGSFTIANAGLPDPLIVASMQSIAVAGPRYPIGRSGHSVHGWIARSDRERRTPRLRAAGSGGAAERRRSGGLVRVARQTRRRSR